MDKPAMVLKIAEHDGKFRDELLIWLQAAAQHRPMQAELITQQGTYILKAEHHVTLTFRPAQNSAPGGSPDLRRSDDFCGGEPAEERTTFGRRY